MMVLVTVGVNEVRVLFSARNTPMRRLVLPEIIAAATKAYAR
jgi:hypothetical protein